MAPIVKPSLSAGEDVDVAGVDVLFAVVRALEDLALTAGDVQQRVCFDARRKPDFPLQDFADRISSYFRCSPSCYVLSMVFLDRVVRLNPEFVVTELNVHRLLLSSMVVATKFNDDGIYSNDFYSKVGGVPIKELNALEAEFIRLLDWRLRVTPDEYFMYLGRAQSCGKGLRLGCLRQGFSLDAGGGGGGMETATPAAAASAAALAVIPPTSSDVISNVGVTVPPGHLAEGLPMQDAGNEKAAPTLVACMAEAQNCYPACLLMQVCSTQQRARCSRRRRPSTVRKSCTLVPHTERRSCQPYESLSAGRRKLAGGS